MLNDKAREIVQEKVDEVTFHKLEEYVNLLLKWNQKVNLIGRSTEQDIWSRHILDSLQLIDFIDNKEVMLTDFGSGAGLPAIVLAIWGIREVHMIEADMKKAIFLKEAAKLCDKKVIIHNNRIENIAAWKSDIITARALAPLKILENMIIDFMDEDSVCLLMKGKNIHKELEESNFSKYMQYKIISSIVDKDSYILQANLRRD